MSPLGVQLFFPPDYLYILLKTNLQLLTYLIQILIDKSYPMILFL